MLKPFVEAFEAKHRGSKPIFGTQRERFEVELWPRRSSSRRHSCRGGLFPLGAGALVALSKSKKHFVGLTWADGDKNGGLAIQCDKNDYRGVLAALEGLTGKKAVNSDSMTVKK